MAYKQRRALPRLEGGTNLTSVGAGTYTPLISSTNNVVPSVSGFSTAGNVLTSSGISTANWFIPSAPTRPGFWAYSSSDQSNVTGDGNQYQIQFDSTLYTSGSGYNTGTSVYTVPQTGWYAFYSSVVVSGFDGTDTTGSYYFISSQGTDYIARMNMNALRTNTSNLWGWSGCITKYMTEGQVIYVEIAIDGMAGNTLQLEAALLGSTVNTVFAGVLLVG